MTSRQDMRKKRMWYRLTAPSVPLGAMIARFAVFFVLGLITRYLLR